MIGKPVQRFFSGAAFACAVTLALPALAQYAAPQTMAPPAYAVPQTPNYQAVPQAPVYQPAPAYQPLPQPAQAYAPAPPVASAAPLGTPANVAPAPASPDLMGRLMSMLGKRAIPRVEIPTTGPTTTPAAKPIPQPTLAAAATRGGVEIPRNFLPIYARGADTDAPQILPFFATAPVNQAYPGVTQLVIMIHDGDREAARAFAFARSAQDEASARHPDWNAGATFLIAPQFLQGEDIATQSDTFPDAGASLLRWTPYGWITGQASVNAANAGNTLQIPGITSFEALDFALLAFAGRQFFPDLKRITVAGTGFGADFVQRYAAVGLAPDLLGNDNIEVQFVAAHTRAFVYLDKKRATANDGDGLGFATADSERCPLVNAWPFGLDSLPAYAKKQGAEALRLRYPTRHIIYLAGDSANLPLNEATPDACALTAQGRTLRARTANFFAYLQQLYGEEMRGQRLSLAPGVNEDDLALWRSFCGTSALYSDGACAANDNAMQIVR